MTLEVQLPEDVIKRLTERASKRGADLTNYVRQLIERDLALPDTMRDLFKPVRDEMDWTGLSEDDVVETFENAREERQ